MRFVTKTKIATPPLVRDVAGGIFRARENTVNGTMLSRFLSTRSSRDKDDVNDDNSNPTNMNTNKKRNATDERTFLERYAMWSHQNPLLALTCIVLVAVGCILTVVLNNELQFVETNDREWVILKDGITSDADAAAEGTRLVEEYVYYQVFLSRRRASHRILTFSVDRDVWGTSKFYLVGVYSFFSRKNDASSDENEQKRKDRASSFPRRDVCVSSSDDVCSREIKREFFDKFPLKRKEGRCLLS